MARRYSTRYVTYGSDEFRQLTVGLIDVIGEELERDLFGNFRYEDDTVNLIETMGDEKGSCRVRCFL